VQSIKLDRKSDTRIYGNSSYSTSCHSPLNAFVTLLRGLDSRDYDWGRILSRSVAVNVRMTRRWIRGTAYKLPKTFNMVTNRSFRRPIQDHDNPLQLQGEQRLAKPKALELDSAGEDLALP